MAASNTNMEVKIDNEINHNYCAQDIAIIVPTKDRPEYVEELLKSLIDQVDQVKCIIIVASGHDIKSTIEKFSNRLAIEYYHTSEAGQLRQRNIGISKLKDCTTLVGCIDDDITLNPYAVKEMVEFWNNAPINTAGVGFNNITENSYKPNIFQRLLLLDHSKPGRVLRSGATSSISNLKENISCQWLTGGMSVWRQDILVTNQHKEINTKWAIGEDLIFSYPIGKQLPLFVCSKATVKHNHYPYNNEDYKWHYFYGKTQTIWVFHFVESNNELSEILFICTVLAKILGKFTFGILSRRKNYIAFSLGATAAILKIIMHKLARSSKKDIREE